MRLETENQKLTFFSKSKLDTVNVLASTFVRSTIATSSREQLELLKQIMGNSL